MNTNLLLYTIIVVAVVFGLGQSMPTAMSRSKLSIHTGLGSESWNFLSQAKPRVVKILDSFGDNPSKIKAELPDTTIIGRIYLSAQPQDGDPVSRAQEWWNLVNATILGSPGVDYWEGYNEPGVGDVASMTWYSQFEVARMKILEEHGLKACLASFSTGTPDVTQPLVVNAFLPAIVYGVRGGHILGLHEYSSPLLWSCFDNSTQTGWMTGRYRKLVDGYFTPMNLSIEIAITEHGIDSAPPSCGTPSNLGGWRKYCSTWATTYGKSDCAEFYVEQLAWYDSILLQDEYVIGATIFQLEIGGWEDYSINGAAVNDLIAYMNSK